MAMTSTPCLPDYNGPKPKNLFTFKLLLPGTVVTVVRKIYLTQSPRDIKMSVATSYFAQSGSITGMIQCMNCMVICLQAEKETHSSWCPGYLCTGAASWIREHHAGREGYRLSRMTSQPASVEHPYNKAS